MNKSYAFSKLFARPSFIEGMSRVLDLGSTLQQYNSSDTEEEADSEALKNDWRAVGDDLKFSIENGFVE